MPAGCAELVEFIKSRTLSSVDPHKTTSLALASSVLQGQPVHKFDASRVPALLVYENARDDGVASESHATRLSALRARS